MRKLVRFRPKAMATAFFVGGVLLAPWASHGCDARGTTLQQENPAAGVRAPVEAQAAAAFHWELSPSNN